MTRDRLKDIQSDWGDTDDILKREPSYREIQMVILELTTALEAAWKWNEQREKLRLELAMQRNNVIGVLAQAEKVRTALSVGKRATGGEGT